MAAEGERDEFVTADASLRWCRWRMRSLLWNRRSMREVTEISAHQRFHPAPTLAAFIKFHKTYKASSCVLSSLSHTLVSSNLNNAEPITKKVQWGYGYLCCSGGVSTSRSAPTLYMAAVRNSITSGSLLCGSSCSSCMYYCHGGPWVDR